MQLSNEQAVALVREGVAALQQGRPGDARRLLENLTATGRANAQIWLLLATACRALDDTPAEETALDGLLAIEPAMVRAIVMKADCRARSGDERGALSFYESALWQAEGQEIGPDLAPDLARARAIVSDKAARAETEREAALAARGLLPTERSARFQQSLDIMAGRKEIFVQRPTGYYFPGLAAIQFFDRADFDWVPAVEAATEAIREELGALLGGSRAGFKPYLHGDSTRARLDHNHLLDSPDWSAQFLCENGERNEATIAQCPHTWAAVQAVPFPQTAGSPTAMFSLLRAGARIAAHTGMFNTRLICHLPLIVPPKCGFRVGNEVREWEVGKLLIFDDTIEHEAWNDSDQDRVVLIFDIWRPDLSARERGEIAALFAGRSD